MTAPTRPTSVPPAPLPELVTATAASVHGDADDVQVTGVSLGSRSVRPGDLYAALPGTRTHGARFAADAVAAGAVAVLTDADGLNALGGPGTLGVPVLEVERPRALLGDIAARVYGHPARRLTVVGVTGTQGKTTVTQLMNAAATAAGRTTAVIGTMGTWIAGEKVESALTTPEAPDLHALFAVMLERGVDLCAMEVSSHALVMGRVDGVVFDLAAYTNFGRDHLDFHHTVEEYFEAKADLFTPDRTRAALLNADDAEVLRLRERLEVPLQTFALDADADWRATDVRTGATGSTFHLTGPGTDVADVHVGVPGRFNVANALTAVAALAAADVDPAAAARGLASVATVAGRMEPVPNDRGVTVVVDYAHKPDALTATLDALRPLTTGRLYVVIGCGGDRDRGKRPIMGEIASRLADVAVITDDNPRTEDPATIRAAMIAGATGPAEVVEVAGRRDAIAWALTRAEAGDAVLIAGKGHETGQYVGDTVLPFDDRQVAAELLGEETR